MATRIPAPTNALKLLIGILNPVGTPQILGSDVREYCVLAMQTGSLSNPHFVKFSI